MYLPTLSISGSIDDPELIANQLLLYFYTSEEAQTYFYTGGIQSMKYLISISNDIHDINSNILKGLYELYESYFNSVNILLELTPIEEDSDLLKLDVDITIDYNDRIIRVSNTTTINKDVGTIEVDLLEELRKGK